MATVSVALASPVSAGAARSSRSPCKQQAAAIPAFASRKRLQRLQRHGVRAGACARGPVERIRESGGMPAVGCEASRLTRVVRLPPPLLSPPPL